MVPKNNQLFSDFISFKIDDVELGRVAPPAGGFWSHGGFNSNPNILNPWRYGSKMAPFDQKVKQKNNWTNFNT